MIKERFLVPVLALGMVLSPLSAMPWKAEGAVSSPTLANISPSAQPLMILASDGSALYCC